MRKKKLDIYDISKLDLDQLLNVLDFKIRKFFNQTVQKIEEIVEHTDQSYYALSYLNRLQSSFLSNITKEVDQLKLSHFSGSSAWRYKSADKTIALYRKIEKLLYLSNPQRLSLSKYRDYVDMWNTINHLGNEILGLMQDYLHIVTFIESNRGHYRDSTQEALNSDELDQCTEYETYTVHVGFFDDIDPRSPDPPVVKKEVVSIRALTLKDSPLHFV